MCDKFSVEQAASYALHKLESGPPLDAVLTRDECIAYYKEMVEIREMEMAARDLYQKKIIRGFLHIYVGQVSRQGHEHMARKAVCCCRKLAVLEWRQLFQRMII